MAADWGMCRKDLYWSANHNDSTWQRHGDALILRKEDEHQAYLDIRDIQSHSPTAQENYDVCHESDQESYWMMARDVFDPAGPKKDVFYRGRQEEKKDQP